MIAIVDYGLGNLKSILYALERLGQEAIITSSREEISSANGIILPGVGAFRRGMENLNKANLTSVLKESVKAGKPILGICLGMQLLFTRSSEHGKSNGLNIIPGRVEKFGAGLKVPHMGWNQIHKTRPSSLLAGIPEGAFFYFAHSYYPIPADAGVSVGVSEYGGQFASAVEVGRVFATQFHPERSGNLGLHVLENFCKICRKS